MKTEDLKNYIFEQLNETSKGRATALAIARGDEGRAAEQAARFAANHFNKIKKQSWINRFPAHPDEIAAIATARDQFTDLAYEKFRKSSRAWNRVTGLKGDGSPRTPTQESAFNFINGLKRLTETSDALKQKLIDGRHEQGWTAARDGDKLFHEFMGQDSNTGKPGKKGEGYRNSALLAVRDIRRQEMKKAWASSDKAKNRLKGLKGDGSPR